MPHALEVRSLNHWSAREISVDVFLKALWKCKKCQRCLIRYFKGSISSLRFYRASGKLGGFNHCEWRESKRNWQNLGWEHDNGLSVGCESSPHQSPGVSPVPVLSSSPVSACSHRTPPVDHPVFKLKLMAIRANFPFTFQLLFEGIFAWICHFLIFSHLKASIYPCHPILIAIPWIQKHNSWLLFAWLYVQFSYNMLVCLF